MGGEIFSMTPGIAAQVFGVNQSGLFTKRLNYTLSEQQHEGWVKPDQVNGL